MQDTQNIFKSSHTGLALIMGASIIIATIIGATAAYQIKSSTNTISVTGSAEEIVVSDVAKWNALLTLRVSADELQAKSGDIKTNADQLKKYIKNRGVKDEELTLKPILISPLCENSNDVTYDQSGTYTCSANRISAYSIQLPIVVETNDVQNIASIANGAVDELLSKGIFIESKGIEYYYSKLADLRVRMLGAAMENAQARAEMMAESTDADLGKLQSASMGVFQITAPNSVDFSDYGYFDTESISKKVTAVVRAGFTLE